MKFGLEELEDLKTIRGIQKKRRQKKLKQQRRASNLQKEAKIERIGDLAWRRKVAERYKELKDAD